MRASERVEYTPRGPFVVRCGDEQGDGVTADGLTLAYTLEGAGPRRWSLTLTLDRSQLLPIAQRAALPLTALDILPLDILRPARLRLRPREELADLLDAVEDERPVVSWAEPGGRLDPAIAAPLLDLRSFTLEGLDQPLPEGAEPPGERGDDGRA